MITIYHMFCFTDFVSSIETRSNFVGYSMLMTTILNMAINLVPIGLEALKSAKVSCAKRYVKMTRYMKEKENEEKRKQRERKNKEFKKERKVLDKMKKNETIGQDFIDHRIAWQQQQLQWLESEPIQEESKHSNEEKGIKT